MKLYDTLLVNTIIEGMNLVAKEGPVVNTRDGVLVLSESSGVHHQLKEGALSISPTDIEGTMEALYQSIKHAGSRPQAPRLSAYFGGQPGRQHRTGLPGNLKTSPSCFSQPAEMVRQAGQTT